MQLIVHFHDQTFAMVDGVDEVRRQNGYYDAFDDEAALMFSTHEGHVKYVVYNHAG